MAKSARIGEMRTRVIPKHATVTINANGFPDKTLTDIFTCGAIWGKWVWEHGAEVLVNSRLDLVESAIFTTWYRPEIGIRDVIERCDDHSQWDVVRVNVVEDTRKYMEITVERREKA